MEGLTMTNPMPIATSTGTPKTVSPDDQPTTVADIRATTEVDPAETLYVPVTNANYYPPGVVAFEGAVPKTPKDDEYLLQQKEALEAQGLISGEAAAEANSEELAKVEATESAQPSNEDEESEPPKAVAPTEYDA
jgi:hypothetical protein